MHGRDRYNFSIHNMSFTIRSLSSLTTVCRPLLRKCRTHTAIRTWRTMSSSDSSDSQAPSSISKNTAKDYVTQNPELNKILSDLYDKFEDPTGKDTDTKETGIVTGGKGKFNVYMLRFHDCFQCLPRLPANSTSIRTMTAA
jgi:hypothetical protein